jgi:NDP-sugar pyrophosphorylase family protein
MEAVLLAAGDASRLVPLSHHRPKGMLLLGGKPILQHAVEALVGNGVGHIVIVTGVHGEKIQSFFGDGEAFGCSIAYAHQAEPTGTADALRVAVPHLQPGQSVVVVPGHLLIDQKSIGPVFGAANRALVSTANRPGKHWIPAVDGNKLASMQAAEATPGSTRVSTGIFHADQSFLDHLQGTLSDCRFLDDALGRFAADHDVSVVDVRGICVPVLDAWDLLRLNDGVLDQLPKTKTRLNVVDQKSPIRIGKNTSISPSASILGPVTIGDGCTIGDRSVIGPYVSIRNNSVIGSHCEIRRSIINNNVFVDSRAVIRGSIIDDGVECGPGFIVNEENTLDGPRGCILGADSTVGAAVLAEAGAILEPNATVASRDTIGGL